jgi:hypothetical protein
VNAFSYTTVIALCGPAGAGKTTAADYLIEKYGAVRYSFAQPLKEMVKRALDFTDEQVYGTQEQKEAIDPRYGHSPRWFLQRIGTEGCRAVFGDDFWTKQCVDMIWRQNRRLAVIDDMRFLNEANAVLDDERFNGLVWRLHPVADAESQTHADAAGTHASEEQWRQVDASLEITPPRRGIDELQSLIDAAMQMTVTLRKAP